MLKRWRWEDKEVTNRVEKRRGEEKEMGEGLVDSLAIFDGNNEENRKENQQFFLFSTCYSLGQL